VPADFTHLHVRSRYSIMRGKVAVSDLLQHTKSLGMRAVALTDVGNMYGSLELLQAANGTAVRPVVGAEFSFDVRGSATPLVLLASGNEGYNNLVSLASRAHDDPRTAARLLPLAALEQHGSGLVALFGHAIDRSTVASSSEQAKGALAALKECLGPGMLFVELQDFGLPAQRDMNADLMKLAQKLECGVVATNCCHYLEGSDAAAWRTLSGIAEKQALYERDVPDSGELYLKSAAQMHELFRHVPTALTNTMMIAEMTAGTVRVGRAALPAIDLPEGETERSYLTRLSRDGLAERLRELFERGVQTNCDTYHARLKHELAIIEKTNYEAYFLTVAEMVARAKRDGVAVGPGRGSGAGSLVAFALRITGIDPIKHELFFERFLNPDRVSMPDIDIDFCSDGREHVIKDLETKHPLRTARIVTFRELRSRSSLQLAGRVLGMPTLANQMSKLIPKADGVYVSIDQALAESHVLHGIQAAGGEAAELLETARALEGAVAGPSTHASGVVLTREPLRERVPVSCTEHGYVRTQYQAEELERIGIVKFDVLGLATLSAIDITTRMINASRGHDEHKFCIEDIPLDDEKTYTLLGSGNLVHVFQLESEEMRRLFRKLKPKTLADIAAGIALYRPGPLKAGVMDTFIARAGGHDPATPPHASLGENLGETYGLMIYQEQVMACASLVAGYTLAEADLLRRAISNKSADEMNARRGDFERRAVERGLSEDDAKSLFNTMAQFAGYGFNKSHAVAYALVTYQTAYLEAHFPAHWLAAQLSLHRRDKDKLEGLRASAQRLNVALLPPEINRSDAIVSVIYGEKSPATVLQVVLGLAFVPSVGDRAAHELVDARARGDVEVPFTSLRDLVSRADLKVIHRGVLAALLDSGSLDALTDVRGTSRDEARRLMSRLLEQRRKALASGHR
jgi:DNA polymerase III subunit alpha